MIARHPHVFGGEALASAKEVREAWERRKVRSPRRRAPLAPRRRHRGLASRPRRRLPPDAEGRRSRIRLARSRARSSPSSTKRSLELKELLSTPEGEGEIDAAALKQRRTEEVGDLLFTVANLARHLEIDPEGALAAANLKFRRRFAAVEAALARDGRNVAEASLDEMEEQWQAAKRAEDPSRQPPG